jgi:hypothetical protein
MPLDPEEKPREFLIIILAVGLKIFGNKQWNKEDYFTEAQNFIDEAERRFGNLNK